MVCQAQSGAAEFSLNDGSRRRIRLAAGAYGHDDSLNRIADDPHRFEGTGAVASGGGEGVAE